jgi:phosphoribosyl 1,2-cyclic phosphodiesterase
VRVTFYGVRGSIPVPSQQTVRYGGNTSCIHIELPNGKDVVIDAGTGIRLLGSHIYRSSAPIYLLLSHNHWDHVQGFPFFAPIYQKDRIIHVFDGGHFDGCHESEEQMFSSLLMQMDGANFPVDAHDLPSNIVIEHTLAFLRDQGLEVTTQPLNHPGGGLAFRLEYQGVSCVYATDNELSPPGAMRTRYEEWVAFCRGADVLIHDAQYLDADMPLKHGWGHSVVSQVRQLALDANVECLALFHHDPDRTDSEVKQIQRDNADFFSAHHPSPQHVCAWEGLVLEISAGHARGRRNQVRLIDSRLALPNVLR